MYIMQPHVQGPPHTSPPPPPNKDPAKRAVVIAGSQSVEKGNSKLTSCQYAGRSIRFAGEEKPHGRMLATLNYPPPPLFPFPSPQSRLSPSGLIQWGKVGRV